MVFKLEIWPQLRKVFVLIRERSHLEAVPAPWPCALRRAMESVQLPPLLAGAPQGRAGPVPPERPPLGRGHSGGEGACTGPFAGWSGTEVSCCFLVVWSVDNATWWLKEPLGTQLGRGTSPWSECPAFAARWGWGPSEREACPCSPFPNTLRISRMGFLLFSVNCKSFGLNMGQVGGQTLVMKSHSGRPEVAVPVKS